MQELLCIESHPNGVVLSGKSYLKLGETQNPCCGHVVYDVGVLSEEMGRSAQCGGCGSVCIQPANSWIWWLSSRRFGEIGTEDEHATYQSELVEPVTA